MNSNIVPIIIQGDNVLFMNVSIHVGTHAQPALIIQDTNSSNVTQCYFYGSTSTPTIIYQGYSNLAPGVPTLDAYSAFNLNEYNWFTNNVVYCSYSGIAIKWRMQRYSRFMYNFVRGGNVQVFFTRNSKISENTIVNSQSTGIILYLPCRTVDINYNNIYDSASSGIKVTNQTECVFYPSNYYIKIEYNTVYNSVVYGIQIDSAIAFTIAYNKLLASQSMGIYLYNSTNSIISHNKIAYFQNGICLEQSSGITVEGGLIQSIYPQIGNNAVKITSGSNANVVDGMLIQGEYNYNLIADDGTNTTIQNITEETYYSLNDEILILKANAI
jgi:parallel beta-helix repeat protein